MTNLEIIQAVDEANPTYLQTNNGESCYKFISSCINSLRAEGREAYHICKTSGEGQYTPPGWTNFSGPGLDGKTYTYTGVSHDAIYIDGKQYDCIQNGNDGEEPLGSPGVAVCNEIPSEFYRPQNPPLKTSSPPVPQPQPPQQKPYPGDQFFVQNVGVPLEADYREAGQTLNAGSATWFARTIWDYVEGSLTIEESVAKHRKEWRQALGLPN